MTKECALCKKNTKLEKSHIIPKFIYKWLKKTSATGHLRFGQNPNRRVQDGFKEYLLCGDCEDLFNEWETEFAANIFHPYIAGKKKHLEYKQWFLKFAISLSWRALLFFKQFGLTHFSKSQQKEADKALEIWRHFLLGDIKQPGCYQQHFLPIDTISNKTVLGFPPNINRYLLRSIHIDPIANSHQALIYIKMPYFIFLGGIQIKPKQWKNTLIHVNKGLIESKRYVVPAIIGEYISEKAKRVNTIQKGMSERQKKKIAKKIGENLDKFVNSETFRAMKADVELFGFKAVE